MPETVSQGDFVKIEYTGKAEGKVFDTTSEKTAKEAGIYSEKAKYAPLLLVAGREQVLKGLDDVLVGSEIGVEKSVTIPSDKAFGQKNPDLVKLISLGEFRKRGIDPAPGLVLDVEGARAVVKNVSGGRVKIDLNHELAGLDVHYSFKIVERITDSRKKIEALAKELLPKVPAPILDGGKATLAVPAGVAKDSDYLLAKVRFIQQTLLMVPDVKNVVVVEEYSKEPQAP